MAEYTKGEWKAVKNAVGTYTIQTDATRIGEIDRHFNARLIGAAPDCYEQLKWADEIICTLCRRLNPQHETCNSCQEREARLEVLAKAEGK